VELYLVSLFVRDAERSLRFYRDGLGFEVLSDGEFVGQWPAMFGVESTRLRAIFLGDPAEPNRACVELVTFADPLPSGPPPSPPATGTLMVAFRVDLERVLPALVELGATDVRQGAMSTGVVAATVRDPDGILVELLPAEHRPPHLRPHS
jgi:catechol 2,3-dioxygenase-like lactoylglutathione lyase family enzyme